MEKQVITYDQPVSLELTRTSTGKYGWTCKVRTESVEQAVNLVAEADRQMRERFLEEKDA